MRVAETFGGVVHLQSYQVAIGSLVVEATKQTTQVSLIHIALGHHFFNRTQPSVVLGNEIAATQIRRHGLRWPRGTCDQRIRNPDDQVLEECGAQRLGIAGAPRSVPDQHFVDVREGAFRGDFDIAAGRESMLNQELLRPSPREIDEVLLKWIVTRRCDIVSDVRTVGKDRPRR